MSEPLVLASASPRRRELLERVGLVVEVHPADVDETPRSGEAPRELVRRLAHAKAQRVSADMPGRFVLAADTVVAVAGQILGKPRDAENARAMLRALSAQTNDVVTGVCLVGPTAARRFESTTRVAFREVSPEEQAAYIASGEWKGKAGGYAVQGLASAFILTVDGSYTNVVGLPVAETLVALGAMGGPAPDFAQGVAA